MLICLEIWQEPSASGLSFKILDTDDNTTEVCDCKTLRQVHNNGYNIVGLHFLGGAVAKVKDFYLVRQDYRYYNKQNMHIWVSFIEYESWVRDRSLFTLATNCTANDDYRRYIIYYKERYIGSFDLVYNYHSNYVEVNSVELYTYQNKPVVLVSASYYDKHYYREDHGKAIRKHIIVYNGSCILNTNFVDEDKIHGKYPSAQEIATGRFEYEGEMINLDLWN
jgi:hypothetical protein